MGNFLSGLGSSTLGGLKDFFSIQNKAGQNVGLDWEKILGLGGAGIGGLMGLFGSDSTANQPQGYQGGIPTYTAQRTPVQQTYDPNRRPGSGGRRYFSDVEFQPVVEAAQGGIVGYQDGGRVSSMPAGVRDRATRARNEAIRQDKYRRGVSDPTTGDPRDVAFIKQVIDAEETLRDPNASARERAFAEIYARGNNPGMGMSDEQMQVIYQAERARRRAAGQGMKSGGLMSLRPKGMYLGGKTDGMADRVPATISGRQPAQLSDGEFVMPADVVSHLGNGNSDAGAQQLFAMMDRIRKARTGRTQQGPQINPSEFTIT